MLALSEKELANWLAGIIRIASPTGQEAEALLYLAQEFSTLAPEVLIQDFPPDLEQHLEYRLDAITGGRRDRKNLFIRWPGKENDQGNTHLILQTHVDTVPWEDWPDALKPEIREDRLIGRGSCDCKGQIALLYQAVRIIGGRDFSPQLPLEIQIVAEEEIGGNGALAAVLQRPRSDAVVVLEPTGLRAFCANRGALWFRIEIQGEATHMANPRQGVNAIAIASRLVEALGQYEQELIRDSRGLELFSEYQWPTRVNVGTIAGGSWPSTVAGFCSIEGGIGYLPNKNLLTIEADLRALLDQDPWLRDHSLLLCNRLRNEAFVTDPNHPLVQKFCRILDRHALPARAAGWNASCDARLYANIGKMPVLVFGAGDLGEAHSVGESVSITELNVGAEILADFILSWFE